MSRSNRGRPAAELTAEQRRELPDLQDQARVSWSRASQAERLRNVYDLAERLRVELEHLASEEHERRDRESDPEPAVAVGAGVDPNGFPLWPMEDLALTTARPQDFRAMARMAAAVGRGVCLATAALHDNGGLPLPTERAERDVRARLARQRGFRPALVGRVAAGDRTAAAEAARKAEARRTKRLEPEREIARVNIARTAASVRDHITVAEDPALPGVGLLRIYVGKRIEDDVERVAELRALLGIGRCDE